MKKNNAPIIFFSVLGLIIVLYFILNYNQGKHFQWIETFKAESDQPYGTMFTKKLLEGYRASGNFIFNTNKPLKRLLDPDSTKVNTDYIIIAQRMHLDDQDAQALADFIALGNNAFIATQTPPEALIKKIYEQECNSEIYYQSDRQDTLRTNFYHPNFKRPTPYQYRYRYESEDVPYHWNFIGPAVFCDATTHLTPLGYHEPDKVNFARLPFGKGHLYLHTNPLLFTNYFLIKEDKAEYTSFVFSHLSGNHIVWDEYSKIPFLQNNNPYNSPLYFILAQPSLKYAWWIFLVTIFLYILFAAKRKQRVIPVLEQKTNTSLEFVNLISTLHYQNGNNLDMARKKMKYFQYFLRAKYGIHAISLKEEHLVKLAQKSGIDIESIRNIFHQFHLIEKNSYSNIEPNRLLDFYYSIDNFYKNCK